MTRQRDASVLGRKKHSRRDCLHRNTIQQNLNTESVIHITYITLQADLDDIQTGKYLLYAKQDNRCENSIQVESVADVFDVFTSCYLHNMAIFMTITKLQEHNTYYHRFITESLVDTADKISDS